MTTITVERLAHVYPGGVRALDGVDMEIRQGERLALVGQNGSGKTTLVRHLNGLLRPAAGRVLHDGEDVVERTVARLARSVGLAFQDPDRQIFTPTVRAEAEFGPRNLGLRGSALRAAVDGALEAVGLAADAASNPFDLGASRRKLLTIASILAMRTPVVILDEPTTGQDLRTMEQIETLIGRLSAEGRTVITITHDLRFAAEQFDRIVVMLAGRVVLDGPPDRVMAPDAWPELRSAWLAPTLPARVGERLGLGATPTDAALVARLGKAAPG
jgi:energy-coupling factor transport system ATP-binding protein